MHAAPRSSRQTIMFGAAPILPMPHARAPRKSLTGRRDVLPTASSVLSTLPIRDTVTNEQHRTKTRNAPRVVVTPGAFCVVSPRAGVVVT